MAKENKAKEPAKKVATMSLKSKNMEVMFSLVGELVHIVVRQPKQQNKKIVITAYDWMQINKGMFNPDDSKPLEKNPTFTERLNQKAKERTTKSDA